jgi:deazaflavin-dependent oxidoreductase (nitroreductase family)
MQQPGKRQLIRAQPAADRHSHTLLSERDCRRESIGARAHHQRRRHQRRPTGVVIVLIAPGQQVAAPIAGNLEAIARLLSSRRTDLAAALHDAETQSNMPPLRPAGCNTFPMERGGWLQRRAEKYLFNPSFRLALRLGIAPRAFALVETTGRRSGRRRLTPVGNGLDGDVFWVVAEHGTGSDYVKNLIANPNARVKVGRRWYTGTATIVNDDDGFARRRRIDEANGLVGRADGATWRASATLPVTVRIDVRH